MHLSDHQQVMNQARYHISYTTLWRRIKDGSLPQPRINRNTRNKLWHIEDLEEYEKN